MNRLAALALIVLLVGCTITRRDPDEPAQPHVVVVVCVLARCQVERAPVNEKRRDAAAPASRQR